MSCSRKSNIYDFDYDYDYDYDYDDDDDDDYYFIVESKV